MIFYSLVQSHQEFQKRSLYCRRTACVGKEDFRISACVDLMTEEGKILEGLTVPLYVLSELELHKPVYLVTTDPKAFYEQADIYPSPYPKKSVGFTGCRWVLFPEVTIYGENSAVSYPAVDIFLCSTDSDLRLVHGKCGSSS